MIRLLDWDLFYGNEKSLISLSSRLISREVITSGDSVSESLFYIHKCVFVDESSDEGGALIITATNNNVKVLLEDSLFYKCYSTNDAKHGGAILYTGTNGQFVVHKVCGDTCHTAYISSETCGQFLYSRSSKGENYKNCIIMSSIINCGSTSEGMLQSDIRDCST